MKAKVDYRSGLVLDIPSAGLAPMLFLEWYRDRCHRLMLSGFKIRSNSNDGKFSIVFDVASKNDLEDARDYINRNIGDSAEGTAYDERLKDSERCNPRLYNLLKTVWERRYMFSPEMGKFEDATIHDMAELRWDDVKDVRNFGLITIRDFNSMMEHYGYAPMDVPGDAFAKRYKNK